VADFKKTLTWVNPTPVPSKFNSLIRYNTYLLGPLNEYSESVSASGLNPGPYGFPVSVDAVYRGKGSYTFLQKAVLSYQFAAGGSDFLVSIRQPFFSSTATTTPPSFGTIGIDLNSTTFGPNAAIGRTGILELEVLTRLTPATTAAIVAASADMQSIQYYSTIKATYTNAAFDAGAAPASLATLATWSVLKAATGYINVTDSVERIWFDLNVYAARAQAVADNIFLLSSIGSTIGGHDGYPYDFAVVPSS
jgi:hypothetical protein